MCYNTLYNNLNYIIFMEEMLLWRAAAVHGVVTALSCQRSPAAMKRDQ